MIPTADAVDIGVWCHRWLGYLLGAKSSGRGGRAHVRQGWSRYTTAPCSMLAYLMCANTMVGAVS